MSQIAGGLILLDKPEGITSFQALGSIKRALETKKVGHTGTLDRFASGLIVALSGRFTRLASIITGHNKTYRARFRFGVETDTLDPEGTSVGEGPVPSLSVISAVLGRFVGDIKQIPPVYSAVHHNGQRAYKLARKGEAPELVARTVSIRRLEIISWEPPDLDVEVVCSKGTYIRSLARDLGREAGSRAHVVALRRTTVGAFDVCRAVQPDQFDGERDLIAPAEFVPLLQDVPRLESSSRQRDRIVTGGVIDVNSLETPPTRVGDYLVMAGEELLAVVHWTGSALEYRAVLGERN